MSRPSTRLCGVPVWGSGVLWFRGGETNSRGATAFSKQVRPVAFRCHKVHGPEKANPDAAGRALVIKGRATARREPASRRPVNHQGESAMDRLAASQRGRKAPGRKTSRPDGMGGRD